MFDSYLRRKSLGLAMTKTKGGEEKMPWIELEKSQKCLRCAKAQREYYVLPGDETQTPRGRCKRCHDAAKKAAKVALKGNA